MPLVLGLLLAACGGPSKRSPVGEYKIGKAYQVLGTWYYPRVDYDYSETGVASWYGPGFHGKRTANGDIYDQMALTAAHRTLPMPSLVRVTNLENGRALVVRVNDRGPFKNGRIIDLSRKAAQLLDFEAAGTAKVRVEILEAESRQFAAIAQGHVIAESAPKAVPVITVDAVPLAPPVAAAPVDRAAEADSAESTAPDTATEEPGAPKQVQSAKLATGPASRPRLRRRSAAAARRTSVSGSPSLAMARPQGVSDWDTGGGGPLAETAEPGARIITIPWPDGTVSQFPIERTSMFIQVGAFLRRDLATRLSARMSVLGRARVTQVELEDRLFFRVRLGPIASLEEADKLLAIVQSSGFNEARVIVD